MTTENEIHDVRKILQDAVAKLAVLERDYRRVLEDLQGKTDQVKFLEEALASVYRQGLFNGLAIAEYTVFLSRTDDALEEIRSMTDMLRENKTLNVNQVSALLKDLIKEATGMVKKEPEAEEENAAPENPPEAPQFSITGKPLSGGEADKPANVSPIASAN